MADDSMVSDRTTGKEQWIPKDNVIFELGATMARLGPQKTILLVPDEPPIHIPGYFDDAPPTVFRYRNIKDGGVDAYRDATRAAAAGISHILEHVTYDQFHTDLPAQGLAFGYLQNFVHPVIRSEVAQEFSINGRNVFWSPEAGITLSIIIPERIMFRSEAEELLGSYAGCHKVGFSTNDGRDLGVYVLDRQRENEPLHVLDIPTTLVTAGNIVERIEHFWREKDHLKVTHRDDGFLLALKEREIINFRRTLEYECRDNRKMLQIVPVEELATHIRSLPHSSL
jgi:hypothetical protein